MVHDMEVTCNTVEYTTAFLYSDFQWHSITTLKMGYFSADSCNFDQL